MPYFIHSQYITQRERDRLDPFINKLFDQLFTKGQINYVITKLIHLWVLKVFGKCYEGVSDGKSILQDALYEYIRKVMDIYEDKKCKENGPISELDR